MNCTELMIQFDKHDLKLVELDGERYMTVRALALALNAKVRSLKKLIHEMRARGELNQGGHIRCLRVPTAGGDQLSVLITYRGVIRISMRSDAPRAARFRDWAEDVLYAVMTGTNRDTHALRSFLEMRLKQIGTANDQAAKAACDLILSLRTGEPTTLPAVEPENRKARSYITAMEWVRKYYPGYCFPCMNGGGKFERYAARRYVAEHRRWPQHATTRLYAWVYSETYDRRFLETCLVEFLKDEVARAILKGGSSKAITAGAEVQSCLN